MPDEDQKILPELKYVRFVRSDLCYKYREGSAKRGRSFLRAASLSSAASKESAFLIPFFLGALFPLDPV